MASISVTSRYLLAAMSLAATSLWHWGDESGAVGNEKQPNTTRLVPQVTRTHEAEMDRIDYLPGTPSCCGPDFEQFSGYFDVSPTRHIFYLYVESQSGNPEEDPVILWTNGGPGCSGILGFGTEHGPYHVLKHPTSGEYYLKINPYSWNKVANMLYIEQPAGVGFSYTDTEDELKTGDAKAAADSYQLILEFFTRFPERQANDFFIASESYGGHYMPQLVSEILKKDTDHLINFKGMMVGNPFVDPYTNALAEAGAYYSHGLVAKPLYEKWLLQCRDPEKFATEECEEIQYSIFKQALQGINPYGLDYPICLSEEPATTSNDERGRGRRVLAHNGESRRTHDAGTVISSQIVALKNHSGKFPPFLPDGDIYLPCAQDNLSKYMRQESVQKALHVHKPLVTWKQCGGIRYSDDDVNTPTIPLFKDLVAQGVAGNHSLNIMVYSGDDDSVCATSGTQAWIWDLGVDAVDSLSWKAWKVNGQTAGFVTQFDLGPHSTASLTFATIHGSGHEVPAYRPMEALHLLESYLNGEWNTAANKTMDKSG